MWIFAIYETPRKRRERLNSWVLLDIGHANLFTLVEKEKRLYKFRLLREG